MIGDTARWRWPEVRVVAVGALFALVAAIVVTAGAQVYADLEGVPFADLSRDAAAVLEGPNYTGAYAMFTVLLWASSAAVALFCALVMRGAGERIAARYLLFGGLITVFMVLDDAFLLHETVGLILGDREEIFFVAYGLATVAFAWLYRRRLGPGLLLLAGAFGCWLSSTALDIVLSTGAPFIVEDGLKLAGVALWAYLMIRISMVEVRRLIPPAVPAVPAAPAVEPGDPDEPVTARHPRRAQPPPAPRPPRLPQQAPPQPVGRGVERPNATRPPPPGSHPQGAGPHPPRTPPPMAPPAAVRPPAVPRPPSQPQPGRSPAPVAHRPVDDATRPVPTRRPAASAVPEDVTAPVGVVPPRRPSDDDPHPAEPRREPDRSRQ